MTDPTVEDRICAMRGLIAALCCLTEKMGDTQGLALSYLAGELDSQFEAIDAVITEGFHSGTAAGGLPMDKEELRGKQAPLVMKETEKAAHHIVCTGGQRQ